MKKLLIPVLGLLMLGGGAAGAYFYFFANKAEAALTEEGAQAAEEHAATQKEEGGHGSEGSGGRYVELDPLILPIIDNDGVSQVVSLVVVLEIKPGVSASEIEAMEPRLKDAFIQDMYGVLNKHAALKGGVLQVSYIKQRLNNISVEVLGEQKIQDVLLQVVQQRPI